VALADHAAWLVIATARSVPRPGAEQKHKQARGEVMAFVSNLIGRTVADVDGERIGTIQDIIASRLSGIPHPAVVALAVRRPGGSLNIPVTDVAVLVAPAIPLTRRLKDIAPHVPGDRDLFLVRDVLDKQIIDTNGVRVVRVNDLELARLNSHFYVVNVDIGGLGLLRRLGLARAAERVARRLGRELPSGSISWDDVEMLPGDQRIQLKVPSDKMAELHPADIAEIVSQLNRSESDMFLGQLDVKMLADTLEEVEPDFQASLVETMPDEKVADVLEEMAPDAAADLLAELPQDRSQDILNLMEVEEAQDVRKLLTYPDDSAGGIMTTDYVTVRPDLTAAQAIEVLREAADDVDTLSYIYVVDARDKLLGAFSLQELVLARPGATVADFMHRRFVSISPPDSQDDAARLIAKYNLLALPVVDERGILHGIVTADDALDKIIPTAWKKRLPRLYH
jgi:CBS domain-containing protein/sporulation protein YlmC with PRC-barrel domain